MKNYGKWHVKAVGGVDGHAALQLVMKWPWGSDKKASLTHSMNLSENPRGWSVLAWTWITSEPSVSCTVVNPSLTGHQTPLAWSRIGPWWHPAGFSNTRLARLGLADTWYHTRGQLWCMTPDSTVTSNPFRKFLKLHRCGGVYTGGALQQLIQMLKSTFTWAMFQDGGISCPGNETGLNLKARLPNTTRFQCHGLIGLRIH